MIDYGDSVKLARHTWTSVLLGIGVALALILSEALLPGRLLSQERNSTPTSPSPYASSPRQELRGVWMTNIDSEVLFSRENLSDGLDRLSQLNFNTVYPTVWNWGYTLYPSAVADAEFGQSLDPHPGLQERDILSEIVEQGHQQGLAVIPWFEFGLMAPSYSVLAQRHPEWITQRQNGTRIVMEGRHPRVWLNPLHPDVQQFIVDLVTEIITTYDVDGIQFDDHFGMPVELGYDDYTIQQYQRDHQGQSPPDDPQDAEWVRWRANKITNLMVQVFYAVKSRKPDCLISLAPNPLQFSYQFYLQDWLTWERLGFVEELIVQVYRNSLDSFVREIERPEVLQAMQHIPVGIGILTGLKNRPVPIEQIQEQVDTVRTHELSGVSFFFYESLGDRDRHFQSLFPQNASRPVPQVAER
ncbi:MAG TPA: glycoside hydrolase family 10 protein [Elainellaceae cyanobacterium]